MATNIELYPSDYPPSVIPAGTELAISDLRRRLKAFAIQAATIRREAGWDNISAKVSFFSSSRIIYDVLPRRKDERSSLGTKGFIAGGEDDSPVNSITRLNYLNEVVSPLSISLSIPRTSAAGIPSASNGYVGGGVTDLIDKIRMQQETTSVLSAALTGWRSDGGGSGTGKAAYFIGGCFLFPSDPSNLAAFLNWISVLRQPEETMYMLSAGLTEPRSNIATIFNPVYTLICGGKVNTGATYTQVIDKLTHLTGLVSPAGIALSAQKAFSSGVGNASNGWIFGGITGSSTIQTIEEVDYIDSSISVAGVDLSVGKADMAALGGSSEGYLIAGGLSAGQELKASSPISSFEKFDFTTRSVIALGIQLSASLVGAAGVSDYSPGVTARKPYQY